MNRQLSSFLNISRWLAAFVVLISHVRNLVLVDFAQVSQKTSLTKCLYFLTGLGHEAVCVFFVISGFLVGGLTLDRWRAKGPDLRGYFIARISRLYVVLIPALLLGAGWDWIGLHCFDASGIYTDAARYQIASLQEIGPPTMDLPTFFGNLFMLQGILTKHLGSNGPLWSLAYEWWYYCVFALIGAGLTSKGNRRYPLVLMGVVLAFVLPRGVLYMGALWGMGLLAKIWIDSKGPKPPLLLGLVALFVALVGQKSPETFSNLFHSEILASGVFWTNAIGVAYVMALGGAVRMKAEVPWPKLQHWLADFSYTTYLSHFPAMLLIVAASYQLFGIRFRVQPDLAGVGYLAIVAAASCLYCWLFSLVTERHTHRIRMWMERRLAGRAN